MNGIIIHLTGCTKFVKYAGSKWVKTKALCKRDGEPIWQEEKSNGTKIDHFGCSRSGCSWPEYWENINNIKEQIKINR